jgi:hypothetical protein
MAGIDSYTGMSYSSQDLICNCTECHTVKGNGCLGGSVEKALDHFIAGKGMGGNYSGEAVNKKVYASVSGPKNYVDCIQYWSDVCDPNEDQNCDISPY